MGFWLVLSVIKLANKPFKGFFLANKSNQTYAPSFWHFLCANLHILGYASGKDNRRLIPATRHQRHTFTSEGVGRWDFGVISWWSKHLACRDGLLWKSEKKHTLYLASRKTQRELRLAGWSSHQHASSSAIEFLDQQRNFHSNSLPSLNLYCYW